MSQMIIANRLTDGLVVFLGSGGAWVRDIADGIVLDSDRDASRYLEMAKRDELDCRIIDPSLIAVREARGERVPAAIREAIRAFGPTPAARSDTAAAIRE